jgi:hypothetical protein
MPNNERTFEIRPLGRPGETSPRPPDHAGGDASSQASSSLPSDAGPTRYEFIDSRELGRRLAVPTSWIRDQVRARSQDPLPHVNFGKYVRFLWGSPALELWIHRRIVVGNNRRVERVR